MRIRVRRSIIAGYHRDSSFASGGSIRGRVAVGSRRVHAGDQPWWFPSCRFQAFGFVEHEHGRASGGQTQSGVYFEIRQQGQPVDPLLWCRAAGNEQTRK